MKDMSFFYGDSTDVALNRQEDLSKFINRLDDGFELLELIFDNQGNVIDFVFLAVNPAYERQTGLKATDILGKRKKVVAPASEERWYDYAIQAVKTAKTLCYEYYNDKVNGYFDTQFIPISINQVAVLFKDITDSKLADESLNNKQRELSTILDSSPIIIFYKDKDGRVIQANRAFAEALKTTKEKLLGKTVFDLYSPEIAQAMTNDDIVVMESKRPKLGIIEPYESPTGLRWIRTDKIPSFDKKGSVTGLIGFSEDITERRNMEKQLKDNERLAAIGQTAGMVGHDIRNPLQSICGELFLMKQNVDSSPDSECKQSVQESLNTIQQQVDYINKIVSDLQDYSRPLKPEYVEVELSELLVSIFETFKLPDNIKLIINVKKTPKLMADGTFLRRALTNLVNNALQAMPDGGELALTAQKQENSVVITVSDTGKGIPESVKANLFTPLITTKAKGQGLGLAVVKRLVEGLNGKVSFESEEGKGTKFIIRLPL
jgi:PAS domain S-box-containing protein